LSQIGSTILKQDVSILYFNYFKQAATKAVLFNLILTGCLHLIHH